MFWILVVILSILWLMGSLTGYTVGGTIHILPVIAIIIGLTRVIQGLRMTKDIAATWSR